jgi:hypothetical protein
MQACVRIVFVLISVLFFDISNSIADDLDNQPDSIKSHAPNIYIDCNYCDNDFLREDLTFVNFVRERQQADVHILVSRQRTGSGGRDYTLEFIGQRRFSGMTDTLSYVSNESDTDDTIRKGLSSTIKNGMVRYIAKTSLNQYLKVSCDTPSEPEKVVDKWNYWVFSISADTWMNGQKSYKSFDVWFNASASRVTEGSRIFIGFWGSYNENKYDYVDYKALSISRSKGFETDYILSLTDHWSAGVSFQVSSSTYSNRDFQSWNAAKLEYNIFPYSESNRRQLRLQYYLIARYMDYTEETIFGKYNEWLGSHQLGIEFELIQPWGTISTELSGSHYFNDLEKNRLRLQGSLSLRVYQGLSFNVDGYVSRIHDQISLRKGEATEEEVLLRQNELATSYSYWMSMGISYSFGSIYNNIVNPRFGN